MWVRPQTVCPPSSVYRGARLPLFRAVIPPQPPPRLRPRGRGSSAELHQAARTARLSAATFRAVPPSSCHGRTSIDLVGMRSGRLKRRPHACRGMSRTFRSTTVPPRLCRQIAVVRTETVPPRLLPSSTRGLETPFRVQHRSLRHGRNSITVHHSRRCQPRGQPLDTASLVCPSHDRRVPSCLPSPSRQDRHRSRVWTTMPTAAAAPTSPGTYPRVCRPISASPPVGPARMSRFPWRHPPRISRRSARRSALQKPAARCTSLIRTIQTSASAAELRL
jgi:hypothetical protein